MALQCLRVVCHVQKATSKRLCSTNTTPLIPSFGDGVLTLTLNSVRTRNALSLDLMKNLRSMMALKRADKELRCVVLQSNGPVFSSGHNLKELTHDVGVKHQEQVFKECQELMMDLVKMPVPVIAAVDGLAAAAGCQLVAMCDIAVATKGSSFSTPGSSFGLFCSTPGVPLARMVPRKVSNYMLLTGKPITAQEALQSGLISRLVADATELEAEVAEITEAIKSKPKGVIALGKRFYYQQLEMGLSKALDEGGKIMLENLTYQDCQEGLEAFKEKRTPKWNHTSDRF